MMKDPSTAGFIRAPIAIVDPEGDSRIRIAVAKRVVLPTVGEYLPI